MLHFIYDSVGKWGIKMLTTVYYASVVMLSITVPYIDVEVGKEVTRNVETFPLHCSCNIYVGYPVLNSA